MKSDHRHELKTNELADWIGHFPEWAKENRMTLIVGAVVVVVAVAAYFWIFYQKDVVAARSQIRLTNLVAQLPAQENYIARQLAQGTDQSYVLLDVARDLQDFAQGTKDNGMAALALIERAQAIRAELHYRLGDISREELTRQIALAQTSYQQALERASSNPALAAKAHLGLGLCEEDLGNFEKAGEIYQDIVANEDYEGTAARAQAAYRLETMDDYSEAVVFKPAPQPQIPEASMPTIQITPGDANAPFVLPVPGEVNVAPVGPSAAPETNNVSEATGAVEVPEANQPAGR